jgi:1-acyl-sn-glycerol-3-phosphate acyltransferase
MSEAFPQAKMTPLYGVCHYVIRCSYDIFFRGDVSGTEHLPKTGPFLIAANHASHLDPPFIGSHVPRQLCFFARKTLWKPGLASWWVGGVGTIPVYRDGGQDVSGLKRVLRALNDGKALILFPEGTRSPDGKLQPAKPGVGFIVCRSQVPVPPARIFGSFEAFGKGARLPRLGTPVSVAFGRPLLPADYDAPNAGKDRYQVVSQNIMAAIARLEKPWAPVV